mmetsp:Transcript_12269/g.26852  ORF Transcript_12269/g.26852 Transcript_12269/m.26852 type:complete len:558 (+) Transcript_12269:106-1779(+)
MADVTEVTGGWTAAAFIVVFVLMSACAVYSLVATWLANRNQGTESAAGYATNVKTTEDFITARSKVDVWKMAFSLYASVLGSWVITSPAIYASYAGLLGLAAYAFACGAPLCVIAWCGGLARQADSEATSLPDFLLRRFGLRIYSEGSKGLFGLSWLKPGQLAATWSALVALFVMGVALLAEYATLGTLFRSFVGCSSGVAAIPTIFMALLTIGYTVMGGLYISILTDRIQAIVSFVLVVFLAIYLAADFDGETPTPLTADQKGFNFYGHSSLFTMPMSLVASTMYSEALWQRVWAAEDELALKKASVISCVFVILVVFFFGFVGFLGLWSGKVGWELDPNLYFFALFSESNSGILDSFAGLMALSCAAMLSEGAADSLQNGITATLSSTLLKGKPLSWTRALVLVVNIPLAIIGSTSWVNNVLNLFLMSNMISVACLFPLLCAVIPGDLAKTYLTEGAVLLGCVGGIVGSCIFGIDQTGNFSDGLDMTFMDNGYAWDYFLCAFLSSAGCTIVGVILSVAYKIFKNRGQLPSSNPEAESNNTADTANASPASDDIAL